jgi:hypothetical protein
MIRRLRAALLTALVWAMGWTVAGILWMSGLTWLIRQRQGVGPDPLSFVMAVLMNWTLLGALSGAVFALVLSLAERKRGSLEALSLSRMALWGAVGGVGLPLLVAPFVAIAARNPIQQVVMVVLLNGVLGASASAGSLQLARRAAQLPSARTKRGAIAESVT